MRTALYARVSTTDQDCAMQLNEMRRYCDARGWKVTSEYVDTGFSGADASRPDLDRLMADARKRVFDAVVVWKLDRFGRSVANLSSSISELDSLGVRFVAVTQGLDTDRSNATGRLMLNILAAVAEFEREIIRERVKAGVDHARAKGKTLGRPRRIWRRDEAIKMRADGKSWRTIARALGIPVTSIRDALMESADDSITGLSPPKPRARKVASE